MDLLNRLNEQAVELWSRHIACQNQKERERLLKRYKEVLSQYARHRTWMKTLDA